MAVQPAAPAAKLQTVAIGRGAGRAGGGGAGGGGTGRVSARTGGGAWQPARQSRPANARRDAMADRRRRRGAGAGESLDMAEDTAVWPARPEPAGKR
jgi:hypothetical protein